VEVIKKYFFILSAVTANVEPRAECEYADAGKNDPVYFGRIVREALFKFGHEA